MGLLDTIVKTAAKSTLIKSAESLVESTIMAAAEGYVKVNEQKAEMGYPIDKQKNILIKVPRSADEFIDMKMDEVIQELNAYGFTNIATLPQKDLFKFQHKSVGKVVKIAANGNDSFKSKAKFSLETRFVITYHELRK